MHVWICIARMSLYLGYRTMPFSTSAPWRYILGETTAATMFSEMRDAKCCCESGFDGKARRKLDLLRGVELYGLCASSLLPTLDVMRDFFAGDGSNFENLLPEELFALCRALDVSSSF